MKKLLKYAREMSKKFPNFAEQIDKLVEDCELEIQGGSPESKTVAEYTKEIRNLVTIK